MDVDHRADHRAISVCLAVFVMCISSHLVVLLGAGCGSVGLVHSEPQKGDDRAYCPLLLSYLV